MSYTFSGSERSRNVLPAYIGQGDHVFTRMGNFSSCAKAQAKTSFWFKAQFRLIVKARFIVRFRFRIFPVFRLD